MLWTGQRSPGTLRRAPHKLHASRLQAMIPLLAPGAVRDIRMLRDRFTGEPRGVAYIQFYR